MATSLHPAGERDLKAFTMPLEGKQVSDEGEFSGYLTVWDEEDAEGDIVREGAFEKTLEEGLGPWPANERPILWQHDTWTPVGVLTAEEDSQGLRIEGDLNMDKQAGREAHSDIKHGTIRALSQGFNPLQAIDRGDTPGRELTEIELWEGSLVTFPAQPEATIQDVRSGADAEQLLPPHRRRAATYAGIRGRLDRLEAALRAAGIPIPVETRTVVEYQDHALADRSREWDADAAASRIRAWAGGDDDLDEMEWSKYRVAFTWYDAENPEQVGSYKLPIADVVDGELRAVPRGVFAAANAVEGGRGGVDIPDGDRPGVRDHLEAYYEKMRDTFGDDDLVAPWNQEDSGADLDEALDEMIAVAEATRDTVETGLGANA